MAYSHERAIKRAISEMKRRRQIYSKAGKNVLVTRLTDKIKELERQ